MRKSGIPILTWILVSYCWQPHGHVHHSEVPLHWLGNSWPCHLALSVTASSWFCMYGEITAAPPPSLPHSSWFCYRRGTLDWQGPRVSWSREATLSPAVPLQEVRGPKGLVPSYLCSCLDDTPDRDFFLNCEVCGVIHRLILWRYSPTLWRFGSLWRCVDDLFSSNCTIVCPIECFGLSLVTLFTLPRFLWKCASPRILTIC